MIDQIRATAQLLNLTEHGLLKVCRDFFNRPDVRDLSELDEAEQFTIYLYLYNVAIAENRFARHNAA